MNRNKLDATTEMTHLEHLLMVLIHHAYTHIATHPNTYIHRLQDCSVHVTIQITPTFTTSNKEDQRNSYVKILIQEQNKEETTTGPTMCDKVTSYLQYGVPIAGCEWIA